MLCFLPISVIQEEFLPSPWQSPVLLWLKKATVLLTTPSCIMGNWWELSNDKNKMKRKQWLETSQWIFPIEEENLFSHVKKRKPWSQDWLIGAGACPGFCSMKRLEVFLLPLDGMLVHRRSLPYNLFRFLQQFAGTHLYTWVERGTVRVKCLAQEHNTVSPASARIRTARSGVEHTNHEATAPPKTK